MKLSMTAALLILCISVVFSGNVHSSSSGPPPSASGVPAGGAFEGETVCAACHTSYPLNPDDQGTIEVLGVPERYVPGRRYTLTFKISHPSASRWGFQATAVAAAGFRGAGDFAPADANWQRIDGGVGERVYIGHAGTGRRGATGIGTAGGYSWSFDWVAPASDVGEVVFYGIGAAANGDGSQLGDRIYSPSPGPLARTRGAGERKGRSPVQHLLEGVEAAWLWTRNSAR